MSTNEKNGTQIAVEEKSGATTAPITAADLLARINRKVSTQEGMLHSVVARFLEYLGSTPDQVALDTLYNQKNAFFAHLATGRHKKASIRSYRLYFNRLLHRAEEFGWSPPKLVIPPEWQEILDGLARNSTKRIVEFAIRSGRSVISFSEDDLKAWCKERAEAGRSFADAAHECSRFRTAISRGGLSAKIPLVKPRGKRYGVSLDAMHPDLRQEIQSLLAWKQNEIEFDRPEEVQIIRPVSAKRLTEFFSMLTGYVQNIKGRPEVTSLRELVTRDHVAGFTNWAKKERKLKGQSLVTGLGMVYAALRYNPSYSTIDFIWFEKINKSITVDTQDVITDRKAKKYIPYALADSIPGLIRAKKTKLKEPNSRHLAIYARNELLMLWILLLPWRQRNIRELRIGGDNPNLIKAKIRRYSTLSKPKWIAALEEVDPEATFWQIRFAPDETKTNHPVQMFLPAELVPLLEDYLSSHRAVLVGGRRDPETLFVNTGGGALDSTQIRSLVKELAFEHTGVPVNPHIYRDVVAFEWLDKHSEDYLTVSKVLWHRNINTTLRIYGSRFDESTGVARMDDWRSNRSKNMKS
jgi:integrase